MALALQASFPKIVSPALHDTQMNERREAGE